MASRHLKSPTKAGPHRGAASGASSSGGLLRCGPGPLAWILGFLTACGFILASYVTKEFAIRHEQPYPNDFLNRLKRRDLRLLLICFGAVLGRPFETLVLAGAVSHACVIGILFKGWGLSRPTGSGRAAQKAVCATVVRVHRDTKRHAYLLT